MRSELQLRWHIQYYSNGTTTTTFPAKCIGACKHPLGWRFQVPVLGKVHETYYIWKSKISQEYEDRGRLKSVIDPVPQENVSKIFLSLLLLTITRYQKNQIPLIASRWDTETLKQMGIFDIPCWKGSSSAYLAIASGRNTKWNNKIGTERNMRYLDNHGFCTFEIAVDCIHTDIEFPTC